MLFVVFIPGRLTAHRRRDSKAVIGQRPRKTVSALLIAVLCLVGAGCGGAHHATHTYTVESSSMEPTLHCARPGLECEAATGDRINVDPEADPGRGDIVVFEAPSSATRFCGTRGLFVMRVVAGPGERWQERGGQVIVGGVAVDEPYVEATRRDPDSHAAVTLGPDDYFVMGDNRRASCDSRRFGQIARSEIVGKVVKISRGS